MNARTVVTVCRTCRPDGFADAATPPGAALALAVRDALAGDDDIDVRAIACLSACGRACSASIAAPDKFAYVIGGMDPADAELIATFARGHAKSMDGVPPWRERPEKVRKNTVSRTPPPGAGHTLVEEI